MTFATMPCSQAPLGNTWCRSSAVSVLGKQSLLCMHSQTEFGNELALLATARIIFVTNKK